MMRTAVSRAFQGWTWVVLAGLVVQIYLAGVAVFGGMSFDLHEAVGPAVVLAILLLLVLALVARVERRVIWLSTLLAALAVAQAFLPSLRVSAPLLAGLHAVNAILLVGLTVNIARLARRGPDRGSGS